MVTIWLNVHLNKKMEVMEIQDLNFKLMKFHYKLSKWFQFFHTCSWMGCVCFIKSSKQICGEIVVLNVVNKITTENPGPLCEFRHKRYWNWCQEANCQPSPCHHLNLWVAPKGSAQSDHFWGKLDFALSRPGTENVPQRLTLENRIRYWWLQRPT